MNQFPNKAMRAGKGFDEIQTLRASIQSGKLEHGEMVGTESAFAQKWGLARNTVRRAVDSLVRDGLLERRPGKGLFVRITSVVKRVVQVIVPNLAWEHSRLIARGAQEAGADAGIQIQIYDAHGRMELDLEVVRRLPDRLMDGAIVISVHHPALSETLFGLKASGFPFVLADQRLHDLEVPTVEIDNYGASYQIGKRIAELGHSRVAFLGPLSLHVIKDRLAGFRDAMLDACGKFDRSLVVDLGGEGLHAFFKDRVEAAVQLIAPLLSQPDRPTAIFDASGDVAPQIYRAAQQAGISIPEQLSVVTFDNISYSQMLYPQVATLMHPWKEMGKTALEMLVRQIDTKGIPVRGNEYEHRIMPAEWIPGNSLARPNTSVGSSVVSLNH